MKTILGEEKAKKCYYKGGGTILLILSVVFLFIGLNLTDSAQNDPYFDQKEKIIGFINEWSNNYRGKGHSQVLSYHDQAEKLSFSVGEL